MLENFSAELSLIVISVLLAVSIGCNILLILFRGKKEGKFDQQEYSISLDALNIILSRYKVILTPVVEHLATQYDTDPSSKTAAISQYLDAQDKLFNLHVKIIINDYLSDDLRRALVKYLGDNGMVLYILMNLKGQTSNE